MRGLSNYTVEELQAEIEERERIRKDRPAMRELPIEDTDDGMKARNKLINAVLFYMDEVEQQNQETNDEEQYIFESVIEYFYGKGVWDWINDLH